MRRLVILLAISVSLVAVQASWGGWLENVIERSAQRATERVIDRAARESSDAAYDKTKEGIKNGSRDESSDNDSSAKRTSDDRRESVSRDNGGEGSESSAAEEVYSNRFDFIPGDKVIFFDDFSDTDVGEFPRKWTLNGGGGGIPLEVVEVGGPKYLTCRPEANKPFKTTALVRWANKLNLPEKFTIEFDAKISPQIHRTHSYIIHLPTKGEGLHPYGGGGSLEFHSRGVKWEHGTANKDLGDNRIHRISISVNGTFVKAYVDGDRVINDPDGVRLPIEKVGFTVAGESGNHRMLLTNFRIAEGGKPIKSTLAANGRIVTHGITFDIGSDRLRPESASTLREILSLLENDPSLKFSVEGHTDNTGSSSSNQSLSEDRAAAVKNWLVSQGIDSGRLTTRGFGDSKPMSSNDTPEGRADNRRVEFVRI